MTTLDVLAIGAHPDDVELTVGGFVARMTSQGRSVGMLDLTRGEMGSRGTPETRKEEAAEAAKVLGVSVRETLDLGDGQLTPSLENRRVVIEIVRKYQPKIVLAPYWDDLHPDHAATGRIVAGAYYPSGFANYPAEGDPHRARTVMFYMSHLRFDPSFIVDITDTYERKMEAIRCYGSQLHDPGSEGPKTNISHPEFLKVLEARDRYYGFMIGRRFGEPFLVRRPPRIDDPQDHF